MDTAQFQIKYRSTNDKRPGKAKLFLRTWHGKVPDDEGWAVDVEFEDGRQWKLEVCQSPVPGHDAHVPVGVFVDDEGLPADFFAEATQRKLVAHIRCSPYKLDAWRKRRMQHRDVINACKKSGIERCAELAALFGEEITTLPRNGHFDGERSLTELKAEDTTPRKACVYMYTADLGSLPDENEDHRLRAALAAAARGDRGLEHWGVIVEFENGPTYTFDGLPGDGNLLNGPFVVLVIAARPRRHDNYVNPVGDVKCSPRELFALGHGLLATRPTYCLDGSSDGINCQMWATAFSEQLVRIYGINGNEPYVPRAEFREAFVKFCTWGFIWMCSIVPIGILIYSIYLWYVSPSDFSQFIAYFRAPSMDEEDYIELPQYELV